MLKQLSQILLEIQHIIIYSVNISFQSSNSLKVNNDDVNNDVNFNKILNNWPINSDVNIPYRNEMKGT